MASLATIISWFKTGSYPTEDQFRETWLSFYHKSEKIPVSSIENYNGYNTATSFANFPVSRSLLVVTLSASGSTFTPLGGDVESHMTIIVRNSTSAEITQEIPATGNWVSWDGNELVIPAGGLAEINIVKADKNYIMFKVKDD
jgi:hypothetical protein